MENDHDYVASGSSSPTIDRTRRILTRLRNTDHNYVVNNNTSNNNNHSEGGSSYSTSSSYSGYSRIMDEDVFLDDDDNGDDDDVDVVIATASVGLEEEDDVSASQRSATTSEISNITRTTSENDQQSSETGSTDNVPTATSTTDAESDATNGGDSETASVISRITEDSVSTVATEAAEARLPVPSFSSAAPVLRHDGDIISLDTPSPAKKRKRLSLEEKSGTPKVKTKNADDDDDEDDGLTCPICLDNWEMSGEHRLSSLKCGHLFGESCIRRWLQESARQSGLKVCPQCKTKAHPKDIRYLYAKRLRAIDRSEEHRMRDELLQERSKNQNLELELATLKCSHAQVAQRIKMLEAESGKSGATYRLFMEKNVELCREAGCRVMKYVEQQHALFVSQKSSPGLFPGYGIRFVDTPTFKPSTFLHTSVRMIRDISLSQDEQMVAVASMEKKAKLFDLRSLQAISAFNPDEKPLWSCAIGCKDNNNYLYLGSQKDTTYIYDIRNTETFLADYQTEGGPVIQIEAVPESDMFPCGGFIICKLNSLWFYEHLSGGGANPTRLSVEGRLISMNYEAETNNLLIQTRSCQRFPQARHILGKLKKVDGIPVFELNVTFFAHTSSPVMVRSTQIAVDTNTLVAAYIQDKKMLSIYDSCSKLCVQSLPVQDVVYDACPIYVKNQIYLAALTETKCRLYKLTISS
ncbi:E3 ubiquitin-protein ligase RFWD3-like [Musca vetustissima]|uniref:E3 ubiquitin-protein ligase RFWD3-like n=1 Tax=Musca vetustissima TaxID=27455 RepID=UPI002AB64A49|nr:E3 ubiquitin-protein ligase RFWD3-like [Musca vetustissima]